MTVTGMMMRQSLLDGVLAAAVEEGAEFCGVQVVGDTVTVFHRYGSEWHEVGVVPVDEAFEPFGPAPDGGAS